MARASDIFFRDHLADPLELAQSIVALEPNETTHELVLRLALAQYGHVQATSSTAREIDAHTDGNPVDFIAPQFYAEGCYSELFRIVERSSRGKKPWASSIPELDGFAPKGVVIARNQRFEHLESNLLAPIRLEFLSPKLQPHAPVKGNPPTALDEDVDEFASELCERLKRTLTRIQSVQ